MSTYVKFACVILGSFFFLFFFLVRLCSLFNCSYHYVCVFFYDSSNKHTLHPHICLRTCNRLGICPTRFLTRHLSLTDIRLINARYLYTYVCIICMYVCRSANALLNSNQLFIVLYFIYITCLLLNAI